MKQQVVVIHGGTTYRNHDEYIFDLRNKEICLDRLKIFNDWKNSLPKNLGDDYEVLAPRMPNGTYAKYKEWKIWFERVLSLLNDEVIFVGHSLGGIFLAKFFSENESPISIKAIILVAAPFDEEGGEESLGDFNLSNSLGKLNMLRGKIFLVQSEDDFCVPFEQLAKYKRLLPEAKVITFLDRGHFLQESFPEVVELIRSVT